MVILMDGGMGQELRRRWSGPIDGLWSARVLAERPEYVEAVHRDFVQAGARVLTVSSYAVTPQRLAAHGLEDGFDALQAEAVERARRARGDGDVRIAGCLPPLVASYRPDLAPPPAEAEASYGRIVAAQSEGVDLFLCETLSSVAEARAAVPAAAASGRPVWAAFTLADEPVPKTPRLRSGEPLDAGVDAAAELGAQVILLNCSRPEAFDAALPDLVRRFPRVGAYANGFTSVSGLHDAGTVDALERRVDLDPDAYAERALAWVDAGAHIVGGCCEVGPAHIDAIRRALSKRGTVHEDFDRAVWGED
jgi:S-methylmethionine-dependent homocysteine/selenocysteine methylase